MLLLLCLWISARSACEANFHSLIVQARNVAAQSQPFTWATRDIRPPWLRPVQVFTSPTFLRFLFMLA